MIEKLLTEQPNPASAEIDTLSTAEMLAVINREDRQVAGAVAREIPAIAKAVDAIAAAIERGGRLFYIGAGTSGRLGVLDASECPPTFGVPAELVQGVMAGGMHALYQSTEASEDDAEAGARDLAARGFHSSDALVGIAASGRTPYVLGAVREARRMGATTAGISCTPRFRAQPRRGHPHRARPGPRSDCRFDAYQGGHRHQARVEHDLHRRDDPARIRLRQPDGERAAQQ